VNQKFFNFINQKTFTLNISKIFILALLILIFYITVTNNPLYDTKINIEFMSQKSSTLELYYNTGIGYNERDVLRQGFGSLKDEKLSFFIKNKIIDFRIDPGSVQNNTVFIKEINLNCRNVKLQWKSEKLLEYFTPLNDIKTFKISNEILVIETSGKDPYFGFKGDLSSLYLLRNDKSRLIFGFILLMLLCLFAGYYVFLTILNFIIYFFDIKRFNDRKNFEFLLKKISFLLSFSGLIFLISLITIFKSSPNLLVFGYSSSENFLQGDSKINFIVNKGGKEETIKAKPFYEEKDSFYLLENLKDSKDIKIAIDKYPAIFSVKSIKFMHYFGKFKIALKLFELTEKSLKSVVLKDGNQTISSFTGEKVFIQIDKGKIDKIWMNKLIWFIFVQVLVLIFGLVFFSFLLFKTKIVEIMFFYFHKGIGLINKILIHSFNSVLELLDKISSFLNNYLGIDRIIRFNKKTVGFLFLLLLLFIILCCFKVHYSSINAWDSYVPPEKDDRTSKIIFGNIKYIRSDEWFATTPFFLNGVSKIKELNFLSHILNIFSPDMWGFYFLDIDRGFSFYWNYWLFGSIIGFFLLLFIVTKNNFCLSIFGTLFFLFSSYNRWWGIYDFVAKFSFIFVFFILFLYSKRAISILISFYFLMVFLKGFVFTFYPPWQVNLGYLLLFLILGYILQNHSKESFFSNFNLKLILFIFAFAIGITYTAYYIFKNLNYFERVLNTVYPGKRVSTGGNLSFFWFLFSGYFDIYMNQDNYFFGNICASSNFIMFYPFIIPIVFKKILTERKVDFVKLFLSLYLLFFSYYSLFNIPEFVAKISLLSYVPYNRALIGIGMANIILIITYLTENNMGKILNIFKSVKSLIFDVFLYLILFFIFFLFSMYFKQNIWFYIDFSKALFVSISFSFLSFLLIKKYKFLFSILLLPFLILPSWGKNPVVIGLDSIYSKSIVRFVKSIVSKDPENKWIVYDNFLLPNLLSVTDAKVFNKTTFPPDIDSMTILDSKQQYKDIWNRYAHVVIYNSLSNTNSIDFKLIQTDVYSIYISPFNIKLKELGIKYFVFPSYWDKKFLEKGGIILLTNVPLNGYWVCMSTNF